MMAIAAFAVTFVLGPLICALLLRFPARLTTLAVIGAAVVIAVTLALRLQAAGQAAQSLVMLWLAWVLAVGMVALAASRHVTALRGRRWLTVIALCATTLPWFGLATARLMV